MSLKAQLLPSIYLWTLYTPVPPTYESFAWMKCVILALNTKSTKKCNFASTERFIKYTQEMKDPNVPDIE